MPGLDDYHAFKSTGSSGGGGASSGSVGCFTWILGILAFPWIVGKLFG